MAECGDERAGTPDSQGDGSAQGGLGRKGTLHSLLTKRLGEVLAPVSARGVAAPRVSLMMADGRMVANFEQSSPTHCFIVDPLNKWKMAWDGGLLLLITYQALLVPAELAFTESLSLAEPYNAFWAVEFAMGILFIADIAISFFTGFVKPDGSLVRDQRQIIVQYTLRWPFAFVLDMIALMPFFFMFVDMADESSSASLSKASRTGRYIRYLRMFRLLRLIRLARAMKIIQTFSKIVILTGRFTVVAAGLFKLLVAFCLVVHLGACTFRGFSEFGEHADSMQVDVNNLADSYLFCVWWLVMTVSGGSPPTDPTVQWEMWIWIFFGVVSVGFVTIATGMLVQIFDGFYEETNELQQKLHVATKFLVEKNLNDEHVKASVLGAVRASFHHHRDVGRFKELVDPLLSEDLRRRLYSCIYESLITWFPPFREDEVQSRFRAKLVIDATIQTYVRGESILYEGEKERTMMFVADGRAMLHSVTQRMKLPVVAKNWFMGERGLFWQPGSGELEPTRNASLNALMPCEVLTISRTNFVSAVSYYELEEWLERQRGKQTGWGCPCCSSPDHWLDACDQLVLTDEPLPLHLAAEMNFEAERRFLASVRPSVNSSNQDPEDTAAGGTSELLDALVAARERFLEAEAALRKQLLAKGTECDAGAVAGFATDAAAFAAV